VQCLVDVQPTTELSDPNCSLVLVEALLNVHHVRYRLTMSRKHGGPEADKDKMERRRQRAVA